MSGARHHRARGGGTNEKAESKWDKESEGSAKEPNDEASDTPEDKEAKERKHGGRVKDCMPERKHGGKVKDEHRVEGKMAKMHMGRPGRKSGGRVGSDKSPLSSAANASSVVDHRTDDR